MTTGEMPKPTTATELNDPAAPRQSPKQVGLRLHRPPLLTNISAARWLLLAIVAASIYFFHGFLVPVLAAMVIALASWPLRERAAHQLNLGRTGAATLLVLVLVCFLLIPIAMALIYAFRELRDWINWAILINSSGAPTPGWMVELPQVGDWLDENWQTYIGRPGGISEIVQLVSGSNIGAIYRGAVTAGTLAFHLALTLLFMLITLFVLYRDGDKIVAQIDQVGRRILPDRWSRLSRVVPATISSTVTGMTLIAIGEGVILGVAYWLAGVPSPVTFGVITGFMALIPGGAPLSFTLVSAYLVASGSPVEGAALFIWGTCELFVVDKTIRPVLVGGPVKLPFLPTFFGLIGGVKTMGIVGLFVGPVLMALLVSIWREWQRELSEEEQRQDSKLIGLE
ncbi:putative PurR-regulated permease PerM [Paracoccus pantotrophus]|uniref:AI-2E family transporter n=1 Tax=Paracoccus pantotrophus TaxID=82367 RepID=A0AAE6NRR0_PARPN|nr:AI-2E family transporter [Paracoccus pantotrophus]QFG34900.1 AI-2E family transporter [Paracoccus pantotrophus]RKS43509.1 putative PurR-regulated permease PerM [Paracoccus pantotrophus]